ncbi:hypothetical protein [Clostridium isatidis]
MSDLISRKAVEKIIKEFFKTKVDEIPKRGKQEWDKLQHHNK